MKIKALIGIEDYSLMVCHCSGNLYHFSIMNQENILHNFEGIYPSVENAIARGKAVVNTLKHRTQNTFDHTK
ncbi:hypothetical protein I4641_00835 [Waterburya agarophytonicola K14]|uniref:Uncharacterized protein n=1 Tax=Waterburya agarophytonicola KI4 TaxID=2874699 RepID=A0A964FDW9_9CYAN|nr:hypothetical protein [Waterburya agarophytonicola]MCC0175526.1 hypothetical protein [Waterburya agarophytonicola KI4]